MSPDHFIFAIRPFVTRFTALRTPHSVPFITPLKRVSVTVVRQEEEQKQHKWGSSNIEEFRTAIDQLAERLYESKFLSIETLRRV